MKQILLLSAFILTYLSGFSQSNQYILNVHISDKSGVSVAGHSVVIIKEKGPVKIQTGKDGVARDTTLLKLGSVAAYTVSIEDPCLNAPYVTTVKTFPGTENLKYVLCNKTVGDLCKVTFKAFAADAKNMSFTFVPEPLDQNNKFSWDFGDGSTAEGSKVQHTYAKAGIYVVTVKMVTPTGCVSSYSEKLTAGSTVTNPNPSTLSCSCCASMDISLSPDVKNIYLFHGKAGFKNAQFTWEINGISISGSETKYLFEKAGNYVITMQAKSDECDVKIKKTLIVKIPTTGGGNPDPNDCKIDFSHAFISNVSSEVKFKPILNDPTISAQYLWNFGDGTSSSEMSPVHKFAKTGTYKVELVVYFSNTKKCTITKEVSIKTSLTENNGPGSETKISKVFPNPVKSDFITLEIKTDEAKEINIQLFNQANQLLRNIPTQLSVGENAMILSLENIENGLYYIVLNNNGTISSSETLVVSK